jgi:hypothetical protein
MAQTRINTILQCFVDLNLETDENSQYFLRLPKISFGQPSYFVDEGNTVNVEVSLEYPSESGVEEVEVGLVINNTDASDFTTLGEVYPKTLIFSAGEQTKVLSFSTNSDLFENEIESFDLILGFFTNTIPGQYITTTVNIIDETNLKEVFINNQGGAEAPSGTGSTLEFSVLEGASKSFIISLDSPSVLGTESVDLLLENITTNSNDYSPSGIIPISWAPGEQNKTITISALDDNQIEYTESLKLKLVNPTNVNISQYSEAIMKIIDISPNARYATANFQGFYIQKGGVTPNVEARYIRRNTTTNQQDSTWRMFIRFGDFIEQNYNTFNPPNTSASAPICGIGCISSYNPGLPAQFQQNNKIFFGKNPNTNQYGDLRLRIKNIGNYPCQISGNTIDVNESITIVVDSFDFKIKLPANDVLLPAGSFYEGAPLSQDTLTECNYDFTFEVDYDGLNFKLRNSNNSVSLNKEFHLGAHRFDKTYSFSDADQPYNFYNLVSGYSRVWPYWEGDFSFPQIAPYCLPAGTQLNPNPNYPTDQGDLRNIIVDGIMFLHQSLSNQNSLSGTKTQYTSFYFLPDGQKVQNSGCTSVNIQHNIGVFSPQLQTSSIPFMVV